LSKGYTRPAPEVVAARQAARLAAVQALYQMELGGASAERVSQDVQDGRLPAFEHGAHESEVDRELFNQIVEAAVERQSDLDTTLARRLAKGWRLERIDSVARAILRAGLVELWRRRDVPTAVVIDEYVEIAKAFFDGPEPSFINATLDACARDVRQDEKP
jgi:transcription antitermination protein NusB